MPKTRARWSLIVLAVLCFLAGWIPAWHGKSFNSGGHWDEHVFFRSVETSLNDGRLLPPSYIYGGLPFTLTYASILPDLIEHRRVVFNEAFHQSFSEDSFDIHKRKKVATAPPSLRSDNTHFRTRGVFLSVSLLAIIWLFWAGWNLQKSLIAAVLPALFFASSWETNYHSRWITADALMFGFSSLTILGLCLAATKDPKWLRLASLGAGLATGCKYTAGLLLLPIFILNFSQPQKTWRKKIVNSISLSGIYFLVFLITTPGFLLDPFRFWSDVKMASTVYKSGGPYSPDSWCWVDAGANHFFRLLEYFSHVVFSSHQGFALALFTLSFIGVWRLWRLNRGLSAALTAFPLAFLMYASTANLMIVRNVLLVIPFFALAAGLGGHYLLTDRRFQKWGLRYVFATFFIVTISFNLFWNWQAARSVFAFSNPGPTIAQAVQNYVLAHPEKRFYLSPATQEWIAKENLPALPSVETPTAADEIIAQRMELEVPQRLSTFKGNHPRVMKDWFGSREINLNYYPPWSIPKLLLFTRDQFVSEGLKIYPLSQP